MLDSICAPKACGGIGFRRMKDLNIALFSKLLWNIAANRNSLWIQFLKAKYLRGKFFFMIIFLLQTLVGFGLISLHANLLSLKVMCTLLTLAHIS